MKNLKLGRPGGTSPAAWFLGPKAENHDALTHLVTRAVASHAEARRRYMPNDPEFVSAEERAAKPHQQTLALLGDRLNDMLRALNGSLPLASYRNQSHMYWDITLPGSVGYFAAMLYNQNNVATEASPVTTHLEIEVGEDLCRMLGFEIPTSDARATGAIAPWGHITCDGSIANGEAMWAARNLTYLPVAVAAAIRAEERLSDARNLTVQTTDGTRARLLELDTWQLLNLPVDQAIGLTRRMVSTTGVTSADIEATLPKYALQNIGILDFYRRHLSEMPNGSPVVMVPATAHYSWPKTAAMIGIGASAVWPIALDADGRMDTVALRRALDRCLAEKRPVLQVVAVVGSTEESAVDPLAEIADIRDEYRQMGLEFALHVDGAWGGYFAAMLREAPPPQPGDEFRAPNAFDRMPDQQLSDYVRRQIAAYPRADSITLDPHKSGFIPYPAGGLCYRNGDMRDLISYTADVVFHGGTEPTVGVYGIEGSKPGAAAAGVYLSHSMIPTDRSGYGRLLGRCIFNNKRFHAALVAMPDAGDIFTVTPFKPLPVERAGGTPSEIAAQIDYIRREIVDLDNDALIEKFTLDEKVRAIFKELGGDLSILNYAFNFRTIDGPNRDMALMNEMNDAMFHMMSVQTYHAGRPPEVEMFVTASAFAPQAYGQDFVSAYARRCGVDPTPGDSLRFLISTTQNPWLTATSEGSFVPTLMRILRRTATRAAQQVMQRHGLTPPQ
ncbi:pyridoxal phosphate-dependent decarboxylase family protein [Actibacterium sp. XHP0104]|uniref:pyridoxal phosphate-dependent decarboxylase family protein n=1 Tax=Actibacterium sp. XHP0104 TaxID=2984335 RepID=UPI0021E7957F|nr:pyridoxal-dependent decarboxylase [Actibacterium sp. XHP0104]MCV2882371.1 pyridoxal-dependent decarboxylase [Actibacterium sp. XHP0104]